MAKDIRYKAVKNLIAGGYLKTFREIFDSIPKSVIYKDLGMNNSHFTELMYNVHLFIVYDIFRIADLIGADPKSILDLVYNQHVADEKARQELEEQRKALAEKEAGGKI